jgi:predicted RNase H-like HicB family nuclease
MTPHGVSLRVTAPISVECRFWAEDDGWSGIADDLGIRVRASSFEEAKKNMEAALADRIVALLRRMGEGSPKSAA